MELLPILRMVRRRWIALLLGIPAAAAVGVLLAPGPSAIQGVASVRVALDTPVSQFVSSAPKGADSLLWRSELLAARIGEVPSQRSIAARAGVAPRNLRVLNSVIANPVLPTTLPRRASEAVAQTTTPYLITVRQDDELPIVLLEAYAPTRVAARRLVVSASREARAIAAATQSPRGAPFVVGDASRVRSLQTGGTRGIKAVAPGIVVFLLWCTLVVLVPALLQMGRAAARQRARTA